MWKTIFEASKEPLRLLVLAIIPILLAHFEVINTEWAIGVTFLLRFIDKWMHLTGKEADVDGKGSALTTGLTRF